MEKACCLATRLSNILCLLFILTAVACEDNPSSVGIEGIDASTFSGDILLDTLFADRVTDFTSFVDSTPTGGTQRLYIGQFDSYRFRIVMGFNIPSSLEGTSVVSAQLRLIASESIGSGGSLTVNLHEINKSWNSNLLLWHNFGDGDIEPTFASFNVNNPMPIGGSSTVGIPPDLVQTWVDALTDTLLTNDGILLDYEGSDFVQQYYSSNNFER